jgi:hypothetical protein
MSNYSNTSGCIRLAIWTILIHAVFSFLHGAAHQSLGVTLSLPQTLFVAVVITIVPLLALILLYTGIIRVGGILLATSMAGSLIFGVYNHFVAISPDHVSHLAVITESNWVWIFRSTAVIIAIIEAFGIWIGLRLLTQDQLTS